MIFKIVLPILMLLFSSMLYADASSSVDAQVIFSQSAADTKPTLRVANWSEFIPLDDAVPASAPWTERSPLLGAFAKRCNCNIEYLEYEAAQELVLRLEQVPDYYDVVILSNGDVMRLRNNGLLEKLDHSKIKSFASDNFTISNAKDPGWVYQIPYLYGTTGVAYREDIVGKDVRSWQDFYYPEDHLKGKVNLPADEYLNFSFALMLGGYSPDTTSKSELHKVSRHLYHLHVNKFIGKITSNVSEQQSDLISGQIAMTIMYSGDALSAIEKDDRIRYVIPKEGGEFYIDGFSIVKASRQKALAYQFIDFMSEVEQQVAASVYLKYATANKQAIKVLEAKYPHILRNPAIYPPEEALDNLYVLKNRPEFVRGYWNKIFK